MKIFKTVIQWVFLFAVGALITGVYFGKINLPSFHIAGSMPGYIAVLTALGMAVMWVDKWHFGVTKPFNCVTCMTSWFSLILAFTFHTQYWYCYLAIGLFIGSLFEQIRNRWL